MSVLFQRLRPLLRPTSTLGTPGLRKPIPSNFFNCGFGRTSLPISTGSQRPSLTRNSGFTNFQWKTRIVYGFIGLNVAVFLSYQYIHLQLKEAIKARDKPRALEADKNIQFFFRNFTLNLDDVVRRGMWWQTITSTITHCDIGHIVFNMLSFYFFGEVLAATPKLGPGGLVTLIVGSGVVGSIGYLVNRAQRVQSQGGRPDRVRALGFSGAVSGVLTTTALMYPRAQAALMGIIPMPLWLLACGYLVYDGLYLNSNTGTAHAGHIGGMAFGAVFYFAKIRGLKIPGSI